LIRLILLLINLVDEASNVDGICKRFGTATNRNCWYISMLCLICVPICCINLGFNLGVRLIITSLRSQLHVSCNWSDVTGLSKQIGHTSFAIHLTSLAPDCARSLEFCIASSIRWIQIINLIPWKYSLNRPSLVMVISGIGCIIGRIQHNSWSGRHSWFVQIILCLHNLSSWFNNGSRRNHRVIGSWF